MQIEQQPTLGSPNTTCYILRKETGDELGRASLCEGCFSEFTIAPLWRRKGYGSFFLKELLRRCGGFDPHQPSLFIAPAPVQAGALAFAQKHGFVLQGEHLVRRRVPDLCAVDVVHHALRAAAVPGGFYLDATCGNGHDTLFLCQLAEQSGGHVVGLDIQQAAVAATNARLAENGLSQVGHAECADHRNLLHYALPGSADGILFNFGWLPGAPHTLHSTAETTLPALRAALQALRPGGLLAAVLYSGKVIGSEEKSAALSFFRALPLSSYTVLVCEFANWADTAPLPCLIYKRCGTDSLC